MKIKLSVFNEDRKTDLIGETFISLNDVIKPGGGEADAWHDLTSKGRYAGQIRIEFTYYDTRQDKAIDSGSVKDQSTAGVSQQDPSRPAGSRQPPSIRRRPLPFTGAMATPQGDPHAIPSPTVVPRSYHTPPHSSPHDTSPRHNSAPEIYGATYESPDSFTAYQSAYISENQQRPLPDPHNSLRPSHNQGSSSASSRAYNEPYSSLEINPYAQTNTADANNLSDHSESPMPYSDDPYALEAVDAGHQDHIQPLGASIAPLRHDRVQQLSNRPIIRPLPEPNLPHSHSAPTLPYEHSPTMGTQDGPPAQDEYAPMLTQENLLHDRSHPSDGHVELYNELHQARPPPPPPTHRNSLPHVGASDSWSSSPPGSVPRYSNSADRAGYEQFDNSFPTSRPHLHGHSQSSPQSMGNGPEARMNSNASMTARGDLRYSPIAPSNEIRQLPARPDQADRASIGGYPSAQSPYNGYSIHPRARPTSQLDYMPLHDDDSSDYARRSKIEGPTLVRPLPTSPGISQQTLPHSSHIARKSVSPRPSASMLDDSQPTTPYSPDSFDSFNPSSRHSTSIISTPPFQRDQSPMYTSQTSTPVESFTPPPKSSSSQPGFISPIIGSNGRIIDPSDHLPPTTYAPEPEPKPADRNRPNITATMRFGPRNARVTPVVTRQGHVHSNSGAGQLSGYPQPPNSSVTNFSPNANGFDHYDTPSKQAGRTRLQKRSYPTNSSPLAPSPPGAVNANHPPPIPAKIPLQYGSHHGGQYEDQYDSQYSNQEHVNNSGYSRYGEAYTLEDDMSSMDISGPRHEYSQNPPYMVGPGGRIGRRN